MKELRTYAITLTSEEIMEAVKAKFSTSIAVQSIPKDAQGSCVGDYGMKFTWQRDVKAHSEGA